MPLAHASGHRFSLLFWADSYLRVPPPDALEPPSEEPWSAVFDLPFSTPWLPNVSLLRGGDPYTSSPHHSLIRGEEDVHCYQSTGLTIPGDIINGAMCWMGNNPIILSHSCKHTSSIKQRCRLPTYVRRTYPPSLRIGLVTIPRRIRDVCDSGGRQGSAEMWKGGTNMQGYIFPPLLCLHLILPPSVLYIQLEVRTGLKYILASDNKKASGISQHLHAQAYDNVQTTHNASALFLFSWCDGTLMTKNVWFFNLFLPCDMEFHTAAAAAARPACWWLIFHTRVIKSL